METMWYEDKLELAMEDEGIAFDADDWDLDDYDWWQDQEEEDENPEAGNYPEDLDYICWMQRQRDIEMGKGC